MRIVFSGIAPHSEAQVLSNPGNVPAAAVAVLEQLLDCEDVMRAFLGMSPHELRRADGKVKDSPRTSNLEGVSPFFLS